MNVGTIRGELETYLAQSLEQIKREFERFCHDIGGEMKESYYVGETMFSCILPEEKKFEAYITRDPRNPERYKVRIGTPLRKVSFNARFAKLRLSEADEVKMDMGMWAEAVIESKEITIGVYPPAGEITIYD